MIKWKTKFLLILFYYYSKFINCRNDSGNQNDVKTDKNNYYVYSLEPEKNQIIYLNYTKEHKFTFKGINELNKNDLLVNFYSIDCDINISKRKNEINEVKENVKKITNKNNIFSILIKNNEIKNTELLVKSLINSGNNNKYINCRTCPVVINSYYIGESKINIEGKESVVLNFNGNLSTIELSYQIENLVKNDSFFMVLSFIFDENLIINVEINNILNRNISNSSNIFLYYNELSQIGNNILNIKITNFKKNSSEHPILIFKIIESNSISILEKNKLNLGFTTSTEVNQYYYLEVFKGEEGEVMLHNKRLYGELYGLIKSKSKIDPYNKENYIKEGKNDELHFDANTRKLSFKSYQTEKCENGCYLLIIYKHENYNFSTKVGFEYTLLARIWDEEEIGSQIINIPFNEYIFGVFEENSINHHYYSLSLPNNTNSIIVQFEGNYVEGFMGFGNKKLNTFRQFNKTFPINEGGNKINKEYKFSESNFTEYISFAFRLKNFFIKEFPLYYFRILLLKQNEKNIIYPLDSNIGTFCNPQKEVDEFFCYGLLKNYYNELSLKYYISTSNQKDKLTYNYFELKNKEIKGYNLSDITQNLASIEKLSDQTILVKFKFENLKIANILSTLSNIKKNIYPQIYSTQMYYFKENKKFSFNLNQSLILNLNYILGQGKIYCPKFNLSANENFKGKPFLISIKQGKNSLNFSLNETKETNRQELIFYAKFQQTNNIKEITQGETLREIVNASKFPLYYYIKNEDKKINHMNVHFIIKNKKDKERNETTFFEISGFIMNESAFNNKRSINGEFIDLKDPIRGSYDICFRNGFLNINRTINKSDYVLIKVDSSSHLNEDEIIMEILTMSKKGDDYTLPINNYITDIYDSTENKSYKIIIDKEDVENKEILVEFIPDFSGISISKKDKNIQMNNITNNDGIVQKYRIKNFKDDFILKVNVPEKVLYVNYIIRYYFTEEKKENNYKLNKELTIKKGYKPNDIILEFNKIEIINKNNSTKELKITVFGYLYENDIKIEFFDFSKKKKEIILENYTIIQNNESFNLYFTNVKSSRKNNYKFNLLMKIVVYESKSIFNEDFFVYTLQVDLEKELKDNEFPYLLVIIICSLASVIIIIIIIIIFSIGFIKLKKSNTNLKEKVLAISFTTGKIDDEIIEKKNSKNDEDYENTFI